MNVRFDQEHAVVTGAGRGIGAAIARALSARGAKLSLMGRQRGSLDGIAEQIGAAQAHVEVADVTDEASVRAAFEGARKRHGPITILINNAGQARSAPVLSAEDELWMEMLDVNLTGAYRCVRHALPDMLQVARGRIVNIASTAGLTGYPYVTAYCAAKHGVVGLTRSLALELARKNITVNAVCPGYTETDLVREAIANIREKTGRDEEQARAAFVARNPQGRLVQPEEVADTVVWLCRSESASVTGQSIAIAGGEVL